MSIELTYINADGITGTLRQRKPFWLNKLDGAGNLSNIINTSKAPDMDGAFFIGSTLDTREISIERTIVADSPEQALLYWKELLRLFTLKQSGTLIVNGLQIACVVRDVTLAASTKRRIPNFYISLLCPSPYFEALYDYRAELALWEPLFKFPLIIPADTGIQMGARQPSQILTVVNAGDVETGMEIVFSALGAVTNPELMNIDSGAFIRVNTTMQAGQEIHVYTGFAQKRITSIIDSTTTNAFSLLDVGSTFLQLYTGTNLLRYNAAAGLDSLEVTLYYRPKFMVAG
jgi:hypothetical protein